MIVSVHIPKTAGMSFGEDLADVFGARLFRDYQDWPEDTSAAGLAHMERRRAEALASADELTRNYDAVHGHFTAAKYRGAFSGGPLVTFVRDPYQHAISTHEHASRLPLSENPVLRTIKERNMTAVELIETFPDLQALYFAGIPIEEFALVGITERYDHSVALFEAICGIAMPRVSARRNVNPGKAGDDYPISADVREAVHRHRSADVELYRRATERFDALCARYGVA